MQICDVFIEITGGYQARVYYKSTTLLDLDNLLKVRKLS